MSTEDVHDNLTLAAQLLRRSAPEEYAAFAEAFRLTVNDVTVAVTQSPPADILRDQGKAQQAQRYFENLTTEETPRVAQQP